MAQILAAQGKDAECEFVLRRCVQEHPRFTPAYNSLAELQMRQGRVHEAVGALSAALKIRPRDPVLLNNLGMCLLLRKEYEGALRQFTEAAGLVPENEKYRREHGHCARAAGPPGGVVGVAPAGPSSREGRVQRRGAPQGIRQSGSPI
jgi:Tfp pilus assembly protein PilF